MNFSNPQIKGWYQSSFLSISCLSPQSYTCMFLLFLTNKNPNFYYLITFLLATQILRDVKVMHKARNHLWFTKYSTNNKRKTNCASFLASTKLCWEEEMNLAMQGCVIYFSGRTDVQTKKILGKRDKEKSWSFCIQHWKPIELEVQVLFNSCTPELMKRSSVFWMTPSRA